MAWKSKAGPVFAYFALHLTWAGLGFPKSRFNVVGGGGGEGVENGTVESDLILLAS